MNYKLAEGPIFKQQFIIWKWLAFNNQGQNCFATHTRKQVIGVAVSSGLANRHIEYAKIIQKETWD